MQKWVTNGGIEIYRVLFGRCNSFLVYCNNLTILVDTGKKSAYKQLIKNIDKLNIPSQSEKILILTHTHYDHCQNAWHMANLHGYKIWVGRSEARFVSGGYTPIPKGTNLFTKIMVAIGKRFFNRFLSYRPFIPDFIIDDELLLTKYGVSIKILPTPGHSTGSVSVIVDDEIALVGDALFGIFPNSIYPPFADDENEMIKSWGRLLRTNCQLFMPAHGRPVNRHLLELKFVKYDLF